MSLPFMTLLAIPILLGILLILYSSAESRWRVFWQSLGAFLLAAPCGGLAYMFTGIEIARARNQGHFFSVPFGGYRVSDSAVMESLASWTVVFFCLILILVRTLSSWRARRRTEETDSR